MNKKFNHIKAVLKKYYKQVDHFSGGVLGIFVNTFKQFSQQRGSEAAASLAYYAFFSIFPMLLVFIVIGSFFVDRYIVQGHLVTMLQGVIPGVESVIIENIDRVLRLRGAVTFVAILSLIWSATSVFNILAKNINRAFPQAVVPNFIKGRFMGFLMFISLGMLLLLSIASTTLSGLIPVINIPLDGRALHETFLWKIGAFLVPIVINLLMFWSLYYWVPRVRVSRKASLTSAMIIGLAWELLNNLFTWYLSSGLSRYRLVYGSLGTIVALLFWIYLTATLALLGAHLTASIQKSMIQKAKAENLESYG
jgi:YihY family inner membrane protein